MPSSRPALSPRDSSSISSSSLPSSFGNRSDPGCGRFVPASRRRSSSLQMHCARPFPNFSSVPQKEILSRNSSSIGKTSKKCEFSASLREQKTELLSDVDEAVVFADAAHPTHEVRPAGCWAPKDTRIAFEGTSGRQRLKIHGAVDLETGSTRMIEAITTNATSTIALLMAIVSMYPTKRLIHVFLDNARYHHAVLVQEWLARPGCRIKLHFVPSYCPHLNPIERLWGLMHQHVTHNRCYTTYNDFCRSVLNFLRKEVPKNWAIFCDSVTDNFRVINPADFRVLKA